LGSHYFYGLVKRKNSVLYVGFKASYVSPSSKPTGFFHPLLPADSKRKTFLRQRLKNKIEIRLRFHILPEA